MDRIGLEEEGEFWKLVAAPQVTVVQGVLRNIARSVAHQVELNLDDVEFPRFLMESPAIPLFLWNRPSLVVHLSPVADVGPSHPFHINGKVQVSLQ